MEQLNSKVGGQSDQLTKLGTETLESLKKLKTKFKAKMEERTVPIERSNIDGVGAG